jgi:hypothetical protein
MDIVFQCDLRGRVRHFYPRQPTTVRQGPDTLARVPKAVAQQKTTQLLAGFTLGVDGTLSAADQIPHGLVVFLRDINRR